jgi:hypothetical protein
MTSLDIPSRILHDLGTAAWFGGSLANAVGLNRAAAEAPDPRSAGRVANTGWNAWTPVNAAAIGANLVGSIGQLRGNRYRIAAQQGVGTVLIVKTALTAAALAATAYSRALGKKVASQHDVPVQSATDPSVSTPQDVAAAQRQLKVLQWVVPALTGGLVAVSAVAGEQQREQAVKPGVLRRLAWPW